jgi:hypothetical protein
MKSVKGRLYCPKDNSYIKILGNGMKGALCDKKCVIISDPYVQEIKLPGLETFKRMMVNVCSVDTGIAYCVLWREDWLIDVPEKIEEYTIEEIAKMLGKDPKLIRIKM